MLKVFKEEGILTGLALRSLLLLLLLLLLLSRFSRVRLCDPRRQPPGSPVPGILQARTQEWVAISFSKKSELAAIAIPWQFTAHHASSVLVTATLPAARMDIRMRGMGSEAQRGEVTSCVFVVSDRQQTAVPSGLGREERGST